MASLVAGIKQQYEYKNYLAAKVGIIAGGMGYVVATRFVTGLNPMLGAAIIGISVLAQPLFVAFAARYTSLKEGVLAAGRLTTTGVAMVAASTVLSGPQAFLFIAVSIQALNVIVGTYLVIEELAKK